MTTGRIPRAAVAITCLCARTQRVVLVTRTKPPNAGKWSLPGGKVEWGETTMAAAARELSEECSLTASAVRFASAPFTTTDAITPDVHYQIAQTSVPSPHCSSAQCRSVLASESVAVRVRGVATGLRKPWPR